MVWIVTETVSLVNGMHGSLSSPQSMRLLSECRLTGFNGMDMVQRDLALPDNPRAIAEYLVQEHGSARAMEIAVEGTTEANVQSDLYTLSIWREVKRILRDQIAESE